MESPPQSSDTGDALIDPSKPLGGIVVCCTSIPPELRSDIAAKTVELGGTHKYDLTPDVTHLVVGEYDTPKYRHVARERPDIRPMAASWIEAVRDLFVAADDEHIGFSALEERWTLKAFETGGGDPGGNGSGGGEGEGEGDRRQQPHERRKLLCCLTGFDDAERQRIIDKIHVNGGAYTGDLTRKVTHLIVSKPEGRKYAAAKSWNIRAVSVEWLEDSAQRGMILDEQCYDPVLPREDRGKGAWTRREVQRVSLGKRLRDGAAAAAQDQGKRKLRKTASMKLNSQRENLWGDILGNKSPAEPQVQTTAFAEIQKRPPPPSAQASFSSAYGPDPSASAAALPGASRTGESKVAAATAGATEDAGVFSSCCFYVHGFSRTKTDILSNTISFLGGRVASSLEEVASRSPPAEQIKRSIVIVPQDSAADTHPSPPDGVQFVTEFFIEKCLHKKRFFNPGDHVIGRPFPMSPIEGFDQLAVCTAGFTGVDLNQVDKTIRQLGARYEERFTPQTSLLICTSLGAVRRQKLDLAVAWRVPVISAEWLWRCISTGSKVPMGQFLFPELNQSLPAAARGQASDTETGRRALERSRSEPAQKPAKRGLQGVDKSAFEDTPVAPPTAPPRETTSGNGNAAGEDSAMTPAHQEDEVGVSAPLSEASLNALNKSPPGGPVRKPLSRMPSEVADSEAMGEERDNDGDDDDDEGDRGEGVTETAAAARKRWPAVATDKLAEQQNATAMAAERLALSTKLTTLLESTAGSGSGTGAGGGPDSGPSREDEAGTATLTLTGTGTNTTRPVRRRREILGRAVSNVSAASSGSAESSAAVAGRASAGLSAAAEGQKGTDLAAGGRGGPPSSTQIEYEDPDARRYRAQLMNKMMGTATGGEKRQYPAPVLGAVEDDDKVTLKDLQAFQDGEARAGMTTRTTRRR